MIEYAEVRTLDDRMIRLVAVRNVPQPRCDHLGSFEPTCEGVRCASCGERLNEQQVALMIEASRP